MSSTHSSEQHYQQPAQGQQPVQSKLEQALITQKQTGTLPHHFHIWGASQSLQLTVQPILRLAKDHTGGPFLLHISNTGNMIISKAQASQGQQLPQPLWQVNKTQPHSKSPEPSDIWRGSHGHILPKLICIFCNSQHSLEGDLDSKCQANNGHNSQHS